MGGSPSTRRVTVINEDTVGVIKVSESVVNRLKGDGQSGVNESRATTTSPTATTTTRPNFATSDESPGQVPSHHRITTLDSLQIRRQKEEEIKSIESKWKSQLEELEHQNQELYKIVTGKLNAAVTEVEEKSMQRSFAPVCEDIKSGVLKCYQDNAKLSLNCSSLVSDFVKCVEQKRNEVILSRG